MMQQAAQMAAAAAQGMQPPYPTTVASYTKPQYQAYQTAVITYVQQQQYSQAQLQVWQTQINAAKIAMKKQMKMAQIAAKQLQQMGFNFAAKMAAEQMQQIINQADLLVNSQIAIQQIMQQQQQQQQQKLQLQQCIQPPMM
jgi:hypothetical protein